MAVPQNPYPDREQEIEDFLKSIMSGYESDTTDEDEFVTFSYTNEFDSNNIVRYTEVEKPDDTESRITRLQRIADSIESKVTPLDTAPAIDNPTFKVNYRAELNDSQYLAATTTEGSVLVIAGAGSGKTRTVVYRVSYLLEKGVPAEQILLLTFTRKAAKEMLDRTAKLLQNRAADHVFAGTFHSFSNHILRRYAAMLNLSPNFTIIDTIDSEDVIDLIRQELKFEKRSRAFPRKGRIQTIISKARNCGLSIRGILEREFTALLEFEDDLKAIAHTYQKYKRANKTLDFDDLMDVLRDNLRDNANFRHSVQKLFRYVMVDEFQDTNVVQKDIVNLLASGHKNLMVVGDDAQSIYAFRGANFENILTFPDTYPKCKVIKLEQNYRSNQDILNFTNSIANNAMLGYKKALFSKNTNKFKPVVSKFYDQIEEADFVVSKILELREQGIELKDMAVLYRSSFHGNVIQAELLKRSIPYVVVGGIRFVEKRHVKDIVAYLRIITNPFDAVAWNRILKLMPGIGKVTASKIIQLIQKNDGKIDFTDLAKRKYGGELLRLQEALNAASSDKITVATKVEILRNYYTPLLKILQDDFELRLQDLDVLHTLACKYEDLSKFLSDFALDPPSSKFQDQNTPLLDESEEKPLTLSTVHSSKGLEWYAVFVPHLLDGLFPSVRSLKNIEYLEEERRLFYVACSRAKEQLYLTLPSYFSAWDNYLTLPSRFIVEIANEQFEVRK